jgi:hypothetical protein
MSNAWRISATALGVACAIAVSVASAEAQKARKKPVSRQQTYQQSFGSQPPSSGPYNRYNLPPGGGINFNDGRSGANYNGGG